MRITINSKEIPQGAIKCVTYDSTSNPSKLIFSMKDEKSAQKISLAVINLLGLIGHYNQLFESPILSASTINDKEVRVIIKGNEVDRAIVFLKNTRIITADVGRIILEKINEGQEIEDTSVVEVTPQS